MHEELIDILTHFLGDSRKHNHSKGQISFDCPVCSAEKDMDDGDGKGNLEINYYKGVYKCWSCPEENHMRGGVSHLIRMHGSKEDIGNYKLIASDLNFDSDYKTTNSEFITQLPLEFQPLINHSNTYDYKLAMQYLSERKIGMDIIQKFNLGYCMTGKYAGRIIVPSYDGNGKINYFAGRTYKAYIRPKYLNPDTDKKTIIFNEDKINWDATIYLVEGPFDHLVVPNSIPLLGKHLDYDYLILQRILEKASGMVIIVLDGDAKKDIKNLYFKLNSGKLQGRVKAVVSIPEEYDISMINELMGRNGVINTLKSAIKIPDSSEIY